MTFFYQDIKLDLLLTFQLPERLEQNHCPVIHPHPSGHLKGQSPHHRHHRVPLRPSKSYLQVLYFSFITYHKIIIEELYP